MTEPEALDHVAVVVVMRRLDQDQRKAALRSTAACLIGMEAPVGAHYLSRRRRLLGRDARLSNSGAHSHIDADKRSATPPGQVSQALGEIFEGGRPW